eukprot:scaffold16856_cov60-Phaeocystis_antarctica.AAC.5
MTKHEGHHEAMISRCSTAARAAVPATTPPVQSMSKGRACSASLPCRTKTPPKVEGSTGSADDRVTSAPG